MRMCKGFDVYICDTREGVNNVFTARPQVKTLTWELVESEIHVLGWHTVNFTAQYSHLLLIDLVLGRGAIFGLYGE